MEMGMKSTFPCKWEQDRENYKVENIRFKNQNISTAIRF